MPICRKFTKLSEAEYFCRLPLKAAMTLNTEVGLDQVDYLENIRAIDETAILFTSYTAFQDEICVYTNNLETVFENKNHCKQVLTMIKDTLDIPNNFDESLERRISTRAAHTRCHRSVICLWLAGCLFGFK